MTARTDPRPERGRHAAAEDDRSSLEIATERLKLRSAKVGLVTALIAALTAVVGTLTAYATLRNTPTGAPSSSNGARSAPGQPPPQNSAKTPTNVVTASIVTPADGKSVPLCTPVAGTVSELAGDRAVWLLLKGLDRDRPYYLVQRITTTVRNAPHWKLDKLQIGIVQKPGQKFELLLLGTHGDLTDEYVHRLTRNTDKDRYLRLPQNPQTLDQITVTVRDDNPC